MTQEQTPTLVTDDLRIKAVKDVSSPEQVRNELPLTNAASKTVFQARHAVHNIMHDRDDRLVVIVGPCSIHDPKAALEYSKRLIAVRDALEEDLVIIMRVYFEKPRTTVGWKGLINDPEMDNSFHINKGLRLARKLLLDLSESGMPAATEYLDLISPQYVADAVGCPVRWGSRTVPTEICKSPSMRLVQPLGRTIFYRLPKPVTRPFFLPPAIVIATLFCAAAMANRITICNISNKPPSNWRALACHSI